MVGITLSAWVCVVNVPENIVNQMNDILFNINPFFSISPLEEYLNKLENNAVSQKGANAKLKLYYLHIDFGIKPYVQGLFDGGLYELDYKKPILYVVPIQSILGKLPVVPVGDTGTIPHRMRNTFSGAPGDRRPGAGDGCRMWFVNSWALGWSRDM